MGMISMLMGLSKGGTGYYYNGFEGSTTSNSGATGSDFLGSVSIVEDDGSLWSSEAYAGSKSYYNNSNLTPQDRLMFSFPVTNINAKNKFVIEFWWKHVSGDSFPTMFDLVGGSEAQRVYIRSNHNYIYAAGIGSSDFLSDNSGWCTWADWNKFKITIDRNASTATISVNGVDKFSGTVSSTWTAYSSSNVYLSFYQFADTAANDNGVAGYLDELKMYSTD